MSNRGFPGFIVFAIGIAAGSQECGHEAVAEVAHGHAMMQVQKHKSSSRDSGVAVGDGNRINDTVIEPEPKNEKKRRIEPCSPSESRSLKDLFNLTGTDKLWRHGYHRYYEKQLAPYREQPGTRILEIGADSGISLGAWLCYFKDPAEVAAVAWGVHAEMPRAKACEISPEHCDRIRIFSLDQSDKVALADMKQKSPDGWDIIIDDGSHKPEHQQISFKYLWEKIRPGGVYVIEDTPSSYVDNGKSVYGNSFWGGIGAPPPNNTVEKFKELVDVVSRKHFSQPDFTIFDGIDKDVSGVYFADSMIFVFKKPSDPEWDNYPHGHLFVGKNDSEKALKAYQEKIAAEPDPELTRF